MKLKEYEGKAIFKKYNIPIPNGVVISDLNNLKDKLEKLPIDLVVKAQILVAGRKKAGGIIFIDKKNVEEVASSLLYKKIKGMTVKELLIEVKLDVEKEFYISLIVDRSDKKVYLLISLEGGVDIEDLSQSHPEKILKVSADNERDIEETLNKLHNSKKLGIIIKSLYKIMKDYDAELVEINPLVESKGKLIAADSKIIIDDNSLFRHPEFKMKRELIKIETEAAKHGLNYVELEGDIGVIGNGAGLVMATLDILDYYGGKAANFLDVGGGASIERMEKALEITMTKNPKKIIINIFGGITKCDEIAKGIINFKKKNGITIPMVVRMIGTNEREAKKILEENGIFCMDSMEAAIKKVVE
ncbi:ADP-forming succinate--CoA ligase subunit beta [Candidatus Bathyarchaeota archaeon]|nr:MAG: ADP-forming succinate--CoA ligase subunit beta [Candidatus Bathyarchaeota archaeon]